MSNRRRIHKTKDLAAFPMTPPVGEHPPTGSPTHRLGVAVEPPAHKQSSQSGAHAHQPIEPAGEYRAEAHDTAATDLITQISVDRLSDCVRPEQGGTTPTERLFAEPKFLFDPGDRKSERLPSRVIEQVAKHRHQQHPPLR